MSQQKFIEISEDFFVDEKFAAAFERQGLVNRHRALEEPGGCIEGRSKFDRRKKGMR